MTTHVVEKLSVESSRVEIRFRWKVVEAAESLHTGANTGMNSPSL